jgi:hypothetical protein
VFEGLPFLFEYVIGMVAGQRRRDSLGVVIHHLLGDVVNAAEYALTHYFPLTLTESFLQNSSIGTPYQKWAKFTNDDFQKVDHCLRRLVPTAWQSWAEPIDRSSREKVVSTKDAWYWFYTINTQYACCVVNPEEPVLNVSAINIDGWVAAAGGRFLSFWNRPWDRTEQPPPIVTKSAWGIVDRATVMDLQVIGLTRLEELRVAMSRFAVWLRANCTMEELTAPHQGTLSDCWLG